MFNNCRRSLDLSNNRLAKLPNRMFVRFTDLSCLDLSNNKLQNLNVDLLAGLENLQLLDLSQNDLPLNNEAYPPGVFRHVSSSLTQLRLEGNCREEEGNCRAKEDDVELMYPDRALSDLIVLQSLYIDGLTNASFGPGFQNMTSLRNLSLSGLERGFCFMNVLRNDTFANVPTGLILLNVSDCNISRIEANAFRPLRGLDELDLSYNVNLGLNALGDAIYGLQGSSLRELHINFIVNPYAVCVFVSRQHTRYLKNTSLEVIHAQHNRLEVFREGALLNMPPTLTYVDLVGNRLGFGRYFKDFAHLLNLTRIRNDGLRWAPAPPDHYPEKALEQCEAFPDPTCHEGMAPDEAVVAWSPELKNVGLRAAVLPRLVGEDKSPFRLPPRLEVYESRWNKLYYRLLEVHFHPKNSLRVLDLSHNLLTTWYGPITGLHHLKSLSLCNNVAHNVSTSFFNTLTSLTSFNGSRNFLRRIIGNDKECKLFEPLVNLKVLDLSNNLLESIPKNYFRTLTNLETLVLSTNQLACFDVNITHMKKFRHLDLSYNNIRYLPQSVMDHLDSIAADPNVTVRVNLTFNPLACTCKHIDFLTWIEQSKVHFIHGDYYTCIMSDGNTEYKTNIFDVIKEIQETCLDKFGMLIGVLSCFFCLLVAIASALIYRYRWKLRYLYHASRLAYRRLHSQEEAHNYEFDAFVSYASEDHHFVHYELIERLEKEKGLKLNIHNRDWMPGRPIPSNIVAAVQSSRRTLVVLTRHLLESDWCEYEMQMATMEAVYTGRDVLLFLLYEDVPSHELPRQVLYDIGASTYITFPHNTEQELVEDFWTRLAQAIRH
nr:hypothetical protein BaRGS_002186 [Batillaria attramentaria]